MRKILVLRGGALGDFIVTLPALAALRARWPGARLELAGNAVAAQLALRRSLLDAVHSQHDSRWSALFGPAPLPPDFAAWLATFDLVLNYWPDPEGDLARRFPVTPAQTYLSAAAMPAVAPAAAHYVAALRPLGIDSTATHYPLATPTFPTQPFIALHPGSGSPRKNWPLARWRELIPQLPLPVTLILGEAESAVDLPAQHILRGRPLEELVSHLASCRLFLGHDSGISHLAAAAGAPCLLLFGPTDPAVWAPPAPRVRVLRHDLAKLPVSDVLAAATP